MIAYDPDPEYQYAFPAISVEGGTVVIVWQERNSVFSNIYLRVKDASGWHNQKVVANFVFGFSGDPVATPVIVRGGGEPDVFLIVWHDYVFNNLRIRAYDYSTDTFGAITDVPSTNSNSMYPSLTADRFHDAHLVWEESGDIYYTKFDYYYDVQHNEHYVWHILKEKVSAGTGYYDHVFPSVTTDYDTRPNVMWEAYSGRLWKCKLSCTAGGRVPEEQKKQQAAGAVLPALSEMKITTNPLLWVSPVYYRQARN
jgi:hypothetical protein